MYALIEIIKYVLYMRIYFNISINIQLGINQWKNIEKSINISLLNVCVVIIYSGFISNVFIQ